VFVVISNSKLTKLYYDVIVISCRLQESRRMAVQAHNAADAETTDRQHRRRLLEKFQVGTVPPPAVRSPRVADESDEFRIRK
jgi:hypothetical protein